MSQRELSEEEQVILRYIQEYYGAQNTEDKIVFPGDGAAVLWVEDVHGDIPVMVNLTSLGSSYADGSIPSKEVLLKEWLRIENI